MTIPLVLWISILGVSDRIQSVHRVYMSFQLRRGWTCQFLEADLRTPLPRSFTFKSDEKIRELIRRVDAGLDLAAEQGLNHGIEIGRGGVWLNLTDEQYMKLR